MLKCHYVCIRTKKKALPDKQGEDIIYRFLAETTLKLWRRLEFTTVSLGHPIIPNQCL